MATLRVSYVPDDEWLGKLTGVVESRGFAGKGTSWFDRAHLRETFIPALRAYPLSAEALPLIEGGFYSRTTPGILEQCHLRIAIRPYDSRGSLLVHVELATEAFKDADAEMQHSATIRFLCEYAALEEFAASLEQVLDGSRLEAVLRSTNS